MRDDRRDPWYCIVIEIFNYCIHAWKHLPTAAQLSPELRYGCLLSMCWENTFPQSMKCSWWKGHRYTATSDMPQKLPGWWEAGGFSTGSNVALALAHQPWTERWCCITRHGLTSFFWFSVKLGLSSWILRLEIFQQHWVLLSCCTFLDAVLQAHKSTFTAFSHLPFTLLMRPP